MSRVKTEMAKLAEAANKIYRERLQEQLEASSQDMFVALEPVSGDHFVAATLSEAVEASRRAHPEQLCYVIRVGHKAAVRLGTNLA